MFVDLLAAIKPGILSVVGAQASTTLETLMSAITIKSISAIALVWVSYLFGVSNIPFIGALGILMTLDMLTGVVAAKMGGKPITPRELFRSATKLLVYSIFLIAGHMATLIVPVASFVDTAMYSFLALTELVSVLENIGKMGYSMPQKLLNQLISLRGKQGLQGNQGNPGATGKTGRRGKKGLKGETGKSGN